MIPSFQQKSLPEFAALEGFQIPDSVAFSGQLELLRNNYDNRNVNDINHKSTTKYTNSPITNSL